MVLFRRKYLVVQTTWWDVCVALRHDAILYGRRQAQQTRVGMGGFGGAISDKQQWRV